MAIQLAHITFDCANPLELAQFWAQVLETPVDEGGMSSLPPSTIT